MNLSCLRARVRSLRRKLALPYAELMLRRRFLPVLRSMGLRPSG